MKRSLPLLFKSLLVSALALHSIAATAVEYPLPAPNSRLVGENLSYTVPDDGRTLEDIAAIYQVGLTNMLEANPGVDPFLPKAGSKLIVPHQLILPDTPRDGIVINVAEMRLYYFQKERGVVDVLPIGIGQLGADTPEEWVTKVQRKKANPTWTPTDNIRRRYAAQGKTLPAVWPAGPDNPMGLFALYIGNAYAIHGTNAAFGIGLRVSSGCVRLRNDDIGYLFEKVPVGTRVQFVNQPVKASLEPNGVRYLEVHQPLSRNIEEFNSQSQAPLPMTSSLNSFIAADDVDASKLEPVLNGRHGMPTQISF